jgi:hypothetical protein
VEAYFNGKERELEAAYADSKLPWKADENAIKGLLLKCLESNYGSVDEAMRVDSSTKALQDIQAILDRSL